MKQLAFSIIFLSLAQFVWAQNPSVRVYVTNSVSIGGIENYTDSILGADVFLIAGADTVHKRTGEGGFVEYDEVAKGSYTVIIQDRRFSRWQKYFRVEEDDVVLVAAMKRSLPNDYEWLAVPSAPRPVKTLSLPEEKPKKSIRMVPADDDDLLP